MSASVLVLANGSPTTEFNLGLRQGDPFAPFFFLTAVKGFVGLVRQDVKRNLLNGVKVGRLKVEFVRIRSLKQKGVNCF